MKAEILSIETLEEINNLKQINKDHQRINGELREQLKQTEELAMEYKINAHDNKEMCLIYKNLYEEEKTKNEKAIELIDSIIKLQEITGGVITPTKYNSIKNILKGSDKK